ncbi:MAG: transporter [Candidatus Caenarcaniphilales bacterium]|nr:transporter [Candidatus Caenarcaniphilales bacterium]
MPSPPSPMQFKSKKQKDKRVFLSFCFLLNLFINHQINADKPIEPISTDRPTFSDSPITVPKDSIQLENGIIYKHFPKEDDSIALPETLIRYGLSERLEFRLTTPNLLLLGDSLSELEASDLSLGAKIKLGPLPGKVEAAVVLGSSLPSGNKGVSSGSVDPFLRLSASKSLSSKTSLSGSLNFSWPRVDSEREFVFQPALAFIVSPNSKFSLFMDYSSEIPTYGETIHYIRPGLIFLPRPKQQLDIYCGVALSSELSNVFLGAGYSFRIDGVFGH